MTGRYVTTQTCIYTDPDLAHWKPLTKFFYRYLYENDHVHGVTGIGRIAEKVMVSESGMNRRQIAIAKEQIADRVVWFEDGTYWVKARAKHTCWTNQGNLHPKFAASAKNCLAGQVSEVVAAFASYYPDMGIAASPMQRRCIAKPSLTSKAVAVAVAKVQDPPPSSPQKPGSAILLPKRVGGFLSRSGNEQRREKFEAYLEEVQTITDLPTIIKALKELNAALTDHEPTNIVAYARPIFARQIKQWEQNRKDKQRLKVMEAETQQRSDDLDRRLAADLRRRLKAGEGEPEVKENHGAED